MPEPQHLLIRADAGGELGTGHVMRMIALAQAWQDRGGCVTLASCQCPAGLIERLKSENIEFIQLANHRLGGQNELTSTIQIGKSLNSPWIVVDGYHFREDYHKSLREHGFKVLAIDDYGHCLQLNVDLLLNQNLHAIDQFRDKPARLPYSKLLLGTEYALLRREFRTFSHHQKNPGTIPRILITFGGVDPENATGQVLKAFLSREMNCHITALLGAGNPNINLVEEACQVLSNSEIQVNVSDMPALYARHDAIVSAAGSSCYEWLSFNIPALVFAIADNQIPLLPYLDKLPEVESGGWLWDRNTDELTGYLSNLVKRIDSYQPQSDIDCAGAERVVNRMMFP